MLESLNDYMSFIALLLIVLYFLFIVFSSFLRNVERKRIHKAMVKRSKEEKGES